MGNVDELGTMFEKMSLAQRQYNSFVPIESGTNMYSAIRTYIEGSLSVGTIEIGAVELKDDLINTRARVVTPATASGTMPALVMVPNGGTIWSVGTLTYGSELGTLHRVDGVGTVASITDGYLGTLGTMSRLNTLGTIGTMDHLNRADDLGTLNYIAAGSIGTLGTMSHLDSVGSIATIGTLDQVNTLSTLGTLLTLEKGTSTISNGTLDRITNVSSVGTLADLAAGTLDRVTDVTRVGTLASVSGGTLDRITDISNIGTVASIASGSIVITAGTVSISSDIEIGAVELKNGTNDDRVVITIPANMPADGTAMAVFPLGGTIGQVTNIPSVDLVDAVGSMGTLNYIAAGSIGTLGTLAGLSQVDNVSSIDLVDAVGSLGTINFIAAGSIGTLGTMAGLSQVDNVSSIDLIDAIGSMGTLNYIAAGSIGTLGTMSNLSSLTAGTITSITDGTVSVHGTLEYVTKVGNVASGTVALGAGTETIGTVYCNISGTDIEIGAVELKNGTSDARVTIAIPVEMPASGTAMAVIPLEGTLGLLKAGTLGEIGQITSGTLDSVTGMRAFKRAEGTTGVVNVGTTPTLILAANGTRESIILVNTANDAVYLGISPNGSTVGTTGTQCGLYLAGGLSWSSDKYTGYAYGVMASGTGNVTYLEI